MQMVYRIMKHRKSLRLADLDFLTDAELIEQRDFHGFTIRVFQSLRRLAGAPSDAEVAERLARFHVKP